MPAGDLLSFKKNIATFFIWLFGERKFNEIHLIVCCEKFFPGTKHISQASFRERSRPFWFATIGVDMTENGSSCRRLQYQRQHTASCRDSCSCTAAEAWTLRLRAKVRKPWLCMCSANFRRWWLILVEIIENAGLEENRQDNDLHLLLLRYTCATSASLYLTELVVLLVLQHSIRKC